MGETRRVRGLLLLVGLLALPALAAGDSRERYSVAFGGFSPDGAAPLGTFLSFNVGSRILVHLRVGGEIGWGEFTLERLTPTELAVSVRRSAVAEAYGPSTVPVCHLIRGVLESLAAATFGRPSTAVETACAAMGAPACRFVAS